MTRKTCQTPITKFQSCQDQWQDQRFLNIPWNRPPDETDLTQNSKKSWILVLWHATSLWPWHIWIDIYVKVAYGTGKCYVTRYVILTKFDAFHELVNTISLEFSQFLAATNLTASTERRRWHTHAVAWSESWAVATGWQNRYIWVSSAKRWGLRLRISLSRNRVAV